MNFTTVVIGIVILLFGIYNLYIKLKKPEVYEVSLKAVQRSFGTGAGSFIHILSRIALPILVGIVTIVLGFLGESLMA
ncbi:MAG: hypothetical protein MJZ19_07595 [Paludibacteraceae bacterium]|nr:hypothetical protein [Paludibacteraceae bacterium]